jgi:Fe-S cluster biosynthesis and repair protein YggX
MVDLKHAEMTNEAQRHQALSNVDKNIEDMKNTVKQELADLKKREDVLRKDTTTPAADIAKELGDIRALRQVILRSGQEEITRMMSERDDKIRNINEYHDKKQAILQTAQKDYEGKGDLKRNDIREDYNKKHEELSDRIRLNDARLNDIEKKLRENTAMLAAGLPANMTTQIAKEISKLSWEKTEVKAEILRLNEKQAELYTQEKLDVQTAIKTYDTFARRYLDQASDKIIKKEEEIAARAAKKEESKKEWNDGVREKLEKMGIN